MAGSLADESGSRTLAALVEHGLFDYLVGAQKHGLRNGEAEGLSHHGVDDEFVARGLLHWEIPGPSTLDDAIDEGGRALCDGGEVRTISNQGVGATAGATPCAPRHDQWELSFKCKPGDSALDDSGPAPDAEDGTGTTLCCGKRLFHVCRVDDVDPTSVQAQRRGRPPETVDRRAFTRIKVPLHDEDTFELRVDFLEQLDLFDREIEQGHAHTSNIGPGTPQVFHQPVLDCVGHRHEDNRDGAGCVLRCSRSGYATRP